MDSVLSAREKALAAAAPAARNEGVRECRSEGVIDTGKDGASQDLDLAAHSLTPSLPHSLTPSVAHSLIPQAGVESGAVSSRLRVLELAEAGLTPLQIARDLELPVGEVELALALRARPG
jgi:hypothetical protein